MRALFFVAVFIPGLLSSCSQPTGGVTRTSAESFEKVLAERLRKLGPVTEVANAKGGEGNLFTRDLSFSMPGANLPPGRLGELVKEILPQWTEFQTQPKKQSSGSGQHISTYCGNERSHLFVDVIARAVEQTTQVDVLVRGIE